MIGLLSDIGSLIGTGLSISSNRKAKKQQKQQLAEIEKQKQEQLKKRKQLIDNQRYNLLGSEKNDVTQNYTLLNNKHTLG